MRNQQDSTFSLTGSGRPRPEVAPVAEVEEPPMAQEVNIHMMMMLLLMMEVNIYDGHSQPEVRSQKCFYQVARPHTAGPTYGRRVSVKTLFVK